MSPGRFRDQFSEEFSWEAQSSAGGELRTQDFFLAQWNGKAREISGDGRTVGLSNRLQKVQGEYQRTPIGWEACTTLTSILQ